jgi:hypothetical protein
MGYRLSQPKEAPRGWLLCKGKRVSALSQALNACAASILTPNRFDQLHFLALRSPNESSSLGHPQPGSYLYRLCIILRLFHPNSNPPRFVPYTQLYGMLRGLPASHQILQRAIGVPPLLLRFMNTPTLAAFSYLFPVLSRTF